MSDSGDIGDDRDAFAAGADDDFDAFNDDTFGTGTAEWEESAHEELAKLTEKELSNLRQTQEFLELGEQEEKLEQLAEAYENGHKLASELEKNLQVCDAAQQPRGHPHQPSHLPDDPAIMSVQAPVPSMPRIPPQSHPGTFVLRHGLPPFPSEQLLLHHRASLPLHLQHPQFNVPPPMPQRFPQPPPPMRVPPPQNLINAQDLERKMLKTEPPSAQQRLQHQQQQQQNYYHRQMQHQQQYRHHKQLQQRGGRPRQCHDCSDDKNRETFGDDFVDSVMKEQCRQQQQQHQRGYQQHQSRNRQAQHLITPGHVHTLGILRSAHDHQQRESTGNPQLDLELERRDQHEEGWQHDYYNRLAQEDDPYAGLMTPRERQWIVNIQMQQLKCENPFVDDYYFTVYHQKAAAASKEEEKEKEEEENLDIGQRQLKRHEEGPQLLLHEQKSGKDEQYNPVQFSNSLGKLKTITVKAPRKIIDVDVFNVDAAAGPTQKESRNYKSTLLEIERLYSTLIEGEDCEKKLAALPTNTTLHKQVEDERKRALVRLQASLVAENRLRRYLMVRKGKTLLRRCFRHLDDDTAQLLCVTLFQILPAAARKDREDKLLPLLWPGIKFHVRRCPFELLIHYMHLLNTGASTKASSSYSTYRTILCHPLGCAVLVLLLHYLGALHSSLDKESRAEVEAAAANVWKGVGEAADLITSPVEPVALEFRKELGECPEQKRLVVVATS